MKKVKRFLMTLLPSFFVVGMCLPVLLNSNKNQIEDPGKDTAIYDRTLTHAQFNRPDIMSADDDEDEEETVKVDKVVLHYYNEAGGCDGRAFYLWVTGVDGAEYNFDNAPVSYDLITGKVVSVTPKVGHFVAFVQSPYFFVAIFGTVFFVALGLFIVNLGKEKKQVETQDSGDAPQEPIEEVKEIPPEEPQEKQENEE